MSASSSKNSIKSGNLPRRNSKTDRKKNLAVDKKNMTADGKRDLTALILNGQLTVDQWHKINRRGRWPLVKDATKLNSINSNDVKVLFVKTKNDEIQTSGIDIDSKVDGRLTADQWNELYYKRQHGVSRNESFLEKFGIPTKKPSVELFQHNTIPQKYSYEDDCNCNRCEVKRSPLARQPLTSKDWNKIVKSIDGKCHELRNAQCHAAGNPYMYSHSKKYSRTELNRLTSREAIKRAALKKYSTEHQFNKYIEIVEKILNDGRNARSIDGVHNLISPRNNRASIRRTSNYDQINAILSTTQHTKPMFTDKPPINNKKPVNKNKLEQQKLFTNKLCKFTAFEGCWKFPSPKQKHTTNKKAPADVTAVHRNTNNTNYNNTTNKPSTATTGNISPADRNVFLKYLSTAVNKKPSPINKWSEMVELIKTVLPTRMSLDGVSLNKGFSKNQLKSCPHSRGNNLVRLCDCNREQGSILMKPGNFKSKAKSRVSFQDNTKLKNLLYSDHSNNGVNMYKSLKSGVVKRDSSNKGGLMSYTKASYGKGNNNFSTAKRWFLCKSSSDGLNVRKLYDFAKINQIAQKFVNK